MGMVRVWPAEAAKESPATNCIAAPSAEYAGAGLGPPVPPECRTSGPGGGWLAANSAPRTPLVQKRRNQVRLGSNERRKVTYTSQTSRIPLPKAIWLMV